MYCVYVSCKTPNRKDKLRYMHIRLTACRYSQSYVAWMCDVAQADLGKFATVPTRGAIEHSRAMPRGKGGFGRRLMAMAGVTGVADPYEGAAVPAAPVTAPAASSASCNHLKTDLISTEQACFF